MKMIVLEHIMAKRIKIDTYISENAETIYSVNRGLYQEIINAPECRKKINSILPIITFKDINNVGP